MGGWMWGGGDDDASVDAIRASLDAGVTLIDTAPAYGLGRAEELVGRAVRGRRNEAVIVTKCGLVWGTDKGQSFVEQDGRTIHRYLGPASVRAELEASLRRLGTDHVDVYITHWQDPTTPIGETMEALLALKAEGKTRAIGISNASAEDLRAYLAAGPVDCIQEAYNMLDRALERELLPLARASGVSVLSYSSLALGLLTGAIPPDRTFRGDDQRQTDPRFSPAGRAHAQAFAAELAPLAEARGADVGQLVIAWTLARPGITFALCGARNADQARANAGAGRVELAPEDIAAIDDAFARHLGSETGALADA
jgi:aryl-alcohol dehydrogenase-like predicted oxidoreductase